MGLKIFHFEINLLIEPGLLRFFGVCQNLILIHYYLGRKFIFFKIKNEYDDRLL